MAMERIVRELGCPSQRYRVFSNCLFNSIMACKMVAVHRDRSCTFVFLVTWKLVEGTSV